MSRNRYVGPFGSGRIPSKLSLVGLLASRSLRERPACNSSWLSLTSSITEVYQCHLMESDMRIAAHISQIIQLIFSSTKSWGRRRERPRSSSTERSASQPQHEFTSPHRICLAKRYCSLQVAYFAGSTRTCSIQRLSTTRKQIRRRIPCTSREMVCN
ncbi:hypothetical protein NEOLEDRAFT_275045 [Neolentinus lepideus HHB14362 ss-1]|uniref:Uncharacterized protein n=1 Tax=Neolentinus lepideus HHB14362 ss-1 TaxID=1314782 RepID=A0A165T5T7_9AGAM|nr:hypothetical protein NEOLEDRAFT_275045 [Neolentinus lepideus HHB14362 ss-1]